MNLKNYRQDVEIYLVTMLFISLGLGYTTQSIGEGDTFIIYNACNVGGTNGGGSNCIPGSSSDSTPSQSLYSTKHRIVYDNGDVYEGELRDGMYNGTGVYISKAASYEGEFLNNKQHGYGINKDRNDFCIKI